MTWNQSKSASVNKMETYYCRPAIHKCVLQYQRTRLNGTILQSIYQRQRQFCQNHLIAISDFKISSYSTGQNIFWTGTVLFVCVCARVPPSIVDKISPPTSRVQPYVLAVLSITDLQMIYCGWKSKLYACAIKRTKLKLEQKRGVCTYLEQRRQSEVKHKLQVWVRKAVANKIW